MSEFVATASDEHLTSLIGNLDVTTTLPTETEDLATSLSSRFLQVNSEVFIAGQIDLSTLPQIKECGIKSVFNLRDGAEDGCVDLTPQLQAEGIKYVHHPIEYDGDNWSDAVVDKILAAVDTATPPVLVYCRSGARAAALGVAHGATRSRFHEGKLPSAASTLNPQEESLLQRVCTDQGDESMSRFVKAYIERKVTIQMSRPGTTMLAPDVYLAGQLSEEELTEMKAQGVKTILNFRLETEAGGFGLGVLAREKEFVESLGMKYVHLPVPRDGPYTENVPLLAAVTEAYQTLQRPLVIHCRTGRRAMQVLVEAAVVKE